MTRLRKSLTGISITNRSRVTNGSRLLAGVDGRSAPARRYRDLVRGFEQEFETPSTMDLDLIRLGAGLALKGEEMVAAIVRGEPVESEAIVTLAGQLRRVLADLKRRSQSTASAPLSIAEHLANYGAGQDSSHDAHTGGAHDEEEGE
jgi:hypothetical protein